jgi:CarD family transcriptional regulator
MMAFAVGDRVVHPLYGVGCVVNVDERQFEPGVSRRYYEVSIPGSTTTLWVPLDLSSSGLRKLTVKSEIARCRRILKSAPARLNDDPRMRQADLAAHLKLGTITAHCEVVRDLTAYSRHKPLSGTIAVFLRVAQDILCQEWAVVEEMTPQEAVVEIEALLEKSRQAIEAAVEA